MKYSILDKLVNKRRSKSNILGQLRTRLWLESILRDNKITRMQLQKMYSGDSEPSHIILKWFKGDFTATYKSVDKMEKIIQGSSFIYKLPLFDLLEDKDITEKRLREIVQPYINARNPLSQWDFPYTQNGDSNGLLAPPAFRSDTETLFYRGDIYGFIGILYHVRLAETRKDSDLHLHYISEAYRAFPGLCRYRHFRRRWEELLQALISIHSRLTISSFLIMPNQKLIKEQIFAKEHITYRLFRARDSKSFRFTEPEKPFIVAEFDYNSLA